MQYVITNIIQKNCRHVLCTTISIITCINLLKLLPLLLSCSGWNLPSPILLAYTSAGPWLDLNYVSNVKVHILA